MFVIPTDNAKGGGHPLSFRDCLFSIFTSTVHIRRPSCFLLLSSNFF